ncbi:MAG: signal peptidase I [Clostridia bacterium]|nr:signal peptidase I [Clostridia bacterium]
MTRDRKILYSVSAITLIAFLLVLTLAEGGGRYIAAILAPAFAVLICFTVRKRGIQSVYRRQVLLVMSLVGVVYLMLYYLSGISFGFARSLAFGLESVVKYILPISSIIISTEIIRAVLAAQDSRAASVMCYAFATAAHIIAFGDLSSLYTFNLFMDFVGLTVFPAIVGNFLYMYVAKRYGALPNIVFSLMTTLYLYVFRYVPALPDAINSFSRLILPILVLWLVDLLYEKRERRALAKRGVLTGVFAVASLCLVISLAMLISCRFRFGLLVIATPSMSDEINVGDAVIYERYDGGEIEVGEIIIFESGGRRVVHRVVDVKRIDYQNRYYTKGDANDYVDAGYITDADIVGRCSFKVSYVGYPTIWLRETFGRLK